MEKGNAYEDAVKNHGEQFKRRMTSVSKQSQDTESACRIRSKAKVTKNRKVPEARRQRSVSFSTMSQQPQGSMPSYQSPWCAWSAGSPSERYLLVLGANGIMGQGAAL